MIDRNVLRAAFAGAILVCTGQAVQAQTKINLVDLGGVTGSASEQGFRIAAGFWESVLTNNVTIDLGVGYAALDPDTIGETSSVNYGVAIQGFELRRAFTGNSALDAALVVPSLTGSATVSPFGKVGTIDMVRNAPDGTGALSSGLLFDTNDTRDNATVIGTSANLKALGFTLPGGAPDAAVTFSTAMPFDFNPHNGIGAGKLDFIGVAIHEIGHALGFTSGVDTYDLFLDNGPGAGVPIDWDANTIGHILDLFRYSGDPGDVAPGAGAVLDWSVGAPAYFSTDGGATVFNGDAYFATGAYNGDGRQASHFKDTPGAAGGCSGFAQVGILDPTFCGGEMGVVKADDLAAMDAIGWNLNFDVLTNLSYARSTAEIYRAATGVPEAGTWAMMFAGFGLAGAALRRRKAVVTYAN